MKRAFDFFVAVLLLFPIFGISIPIAIAIRLDSPGPVLFRQVRVGRHGKTFVLLKWRTMSVDTGDLPSHEVAREKVTRIGSMLRRTKLDELPQIWNVLIGEMSLVGPRPCLPSQVKLVTERERLGVSRIRPGITGMSQILGIDMSDPCRLAAKDAEYAGNISMLIDLKIMLQTVFNRSLQDAVRS